MPAVDVHARAALARAGRFDPLPWLCHTTIGFPYKVGTCTLGTSNIGKTGRISATSEIDETSEKRYITYYEPNVTTAD